MAAASDLITGEASFTASFIATARGLGEYLPEDARLVLDPYGTRFAVRWLTFVVKHARRLAPLLQPLLVTVQLRTRFIDDLLAAFLRDGGTQIVVLGAGFDCRAARFKSELAHLGATLFEVDHPATQARKRATVEDSAAKYVAFDFESRRIDDLVAALAEAGFDRSKASLTIWEGVTMYLTADAVDATVRAVREWSAPRSTFVFTYMTPRAIRPPWLVVRILRRLVTGAAEPLQFAFVPREVPAWLQERRFAMSGDVGITELGKLLLPPRYQVRNDELRFVVAKPVELDQRRA